MIQGAEGSSLEGLHPSWSQIPTSLLKAELSRRAEENEKPACGSGTTKSAYNTGLHVAALVIILVLSVGACSFPIVVRRFPGLPVPHRFLFLSRHFGTGVLIATAFVHLLPTAFISLTDPCLPPFWNQGYEAMAGLIAMTSVLIVVGIEMFFATRGAGHIHGSEYDSLRVEDGHSGHVRTHRHTGSGSFKRFRQGRLGDNLRPPDIQLGEFSSSTDGLVDGQSPSLATPSSIPEGIRKPAPNDADSDSDLDIDIDELDPSAPSRSGLLNGTPKRTPPPSDLSSPVLDSNNPPNANDPQQKKLLLQCLLLEAGILFHSVFIGMALSVSVGPAFIVLLIAISFHQTFEGLALGSRIAALAFPPSSPKPWLMSLAYGTTTPLGQAIGLAIHTLYDPASEAGLLTVGVMNAISSGLLLFAGLVELLAEDFLSDQSYETLKGRARLEACGAVVSGAMLMALVGAWA
ncbi:Zinc/iron permease [Aulographum hederae CBS 113979]|uniref:Zinc/iron permease n=1 Tax=Aulographum hederae CBS 113979 TaxID=1176131 RepID=A0A6G1H9R9_9PEZI|nr:Zinc/iron permease [Aulographum hederae CBS 113979]